MPNADKYLARATTLCEQYYQANRVLEKRIVQLQNRGLLPKLPDYNCERKSSIRLTAVEAISKEDRTLLRASKDKRLNWIYNECKELEERLQSAEARALYKSAEVPNWNSATTS